MSIIYDPSKLLRKIAPKHKIKKILKGNFSLKRTALSFVDDIDFLDKKQILETSLKVVKNYKQRVKDLRADSENMTTKALGKAVDAIEETIDDPKLLIHRVQDDVVWQVKEAIKDSYDGEFYVWLPSDAEEPDPEHQLNYGKTFQVGVGEMPGDRYGCRCGMEILVKGTKLELD